MNILLYIMSDDHAANVVSIYSSMLSRYMKTPSDFELMKMLFKEKERLGDDDRQYPKIGQRFWS